MYNKFIENFRLVVQNIILIIMVDHSSHHAGHSMDNDMDGAESGMMMTMTMYFYQSTKVHFLFESYDVTSASGYFSVLLVAFIFGFLTETLSIVQDRFD